MVICHCVPPLLSTFVCPTEITAFSDRVNEFHSINAEVVACSVDSKYTHLAWRKTARDKGGLGDLNIALLSDINKQIARDYGVLLEDEGVSLRWVWLLVMSVANHHVCHYAQGPVHY